MHDRAKFSSRSQQEGESVEDFIIYHVNALADKYAYGQLRDEMVRDRIVVGIRDAKLSQKLQMDPDLTLEKATKLVRESEAIKLQQTAIRPEDTTNLGAVNSWHHGQKTTKSRQTPPTQPSVTCARCSKAPHSRMQCPARDQICHKCKKKGHFQNCAEVKAVPRGIREIQEDSDEDFMGAVHVDTTDSEAI